MELMDIIKKRKSVRKYTPKPIEREKLIKCIEAARLAPSVDNLQPWRFIVIDDPEMKKNFCSHICRGIFRPTGFIEDAPVIIIILAKLNFIIHKIGKIVTKINLHLLDIGIAGEHLVLRAQELGIGTCWINRFNAKKANKYLGLRRKYRVVSLIALGYPARGATRNKPDHPIEKILYFNDDFRKDLH